MSSTGLVATGLFLLCLQLVCIPLSAAPVGRGRMQPKPPAKIPGTGHMRTLAAMDPALSLCCVSELWLAPDSHRHVHVCMCVSKAWQRMAQETLKHRTAVTVSSRVEPHEFCRSRFDCKLAGALHAASIGMLRIIELRLHGLCNLSDDALRPVARLSSLTTVALTHCTSLTAAISCYLPRSVAKLDLAGCHLIYGCLAALGRAYELDIHVCAPALQLVEQQSLGGFRFVDPAQRAGVRQGCSTACHAACGVCARPCPAIEDVDGVVRVPAEVWHASSFDWVMTHSHVLQSFAEVG